jgi:DNA-binding CsgD family transcriptional regulator
MEGIRMRDLRGGLRVLRDIGAAGPGVPGFARAGVQALPSLVASEVTTLSVCDLASGHRTVFGTPGAALNAQDQACFDRFFREHPLVRYHGELHGRGAHRISDSLPFSSFRETPLYNEYYRRIGIDHVIALPIQVDARTLVSFVLNRRGRDFSDRERDVLDLLREHLSQLYLRSQALEAAQAALAGLNLMTGPSGSAWLRPGPQRELIAAPERFAGLPLTPRERDVMRWLAAGKTDRDIAAVLGCSHRTVQKHLERIYGKLGVETRTAAVMRALAPKQA